MNLMTGNEVDVLLRWPSGRAERLARRGRLPHYVMPDGKTMRFDRAEVEALIVAVPARRTAASKSSGIPSGDEDPSGSVAS